MRETRTDQARRSALDGQRATAIRSHRLFVRAMECSRTGIHPGVAVAELHRACRGDPLSAVLARGYCLALLELMPDDRHVSHALELLLEVSP
jgi:hypothetical protein